MPDPPDDGIATATIADPVVAKGFTIIPNAILERSDLSLGAKLAYAALKHVVWRDQGLAPMSEIARMLSLGERAARNYVHELESAPCLEGSPESGTLVKSTRRGLGLPNTYVVYEPAVLITKNLQSRTADSAVQERLILPVSARARSLSLSLTLPLTSSLAGPSSQNQLQDEERQDTSWGMETNRPTKVDRKAVTDKEFTLAAQILAGFNEQAHTSYASKEWVSKAVMRIREHPEVTLEEHLAIIARSLADPWWRGNPNPSVIYGNAAQFERSLHRVNEPLADVPLTPDQIRDLVDADLAQWDGR